jgi:hypothetical protein
MQGKWGGVNTAVQAAVVVGQEKLEEYTRKIDIETIIPYAAAALDPRVKTDLFYFYLKEKAINVINNVRAYFKEISPPPEPTLPLERPASTPLASSSSYTGHSFVGRVRGLQVLASRQDMLWRIQERHYSAVINVEVDEINKWFDSPPIREQVPENITAEQDTQWLIAWWRTNRFKYPRMAKIARQYLSIPASEVRVERLFSRGRDLLGLRRYAL